MSIEKVSRDRWESWCDRISKELGAALVEIEVAGLDVGDQIEAEWVPLSGISYDPKDDVLSVETEVLEHLIRNPVELLAEQEADGLHSITVVDREGHRQVIRLRRPLALPEP